jgi:hypothetical protein
LHLPDAPAGQPNGSAVSPILAGHRGIRASRPTPTSDLVGGSRLRDRIGTKAGGRYDLRDSPFVVAVGVHDAVCTDHDVVEALYGGESAAVDSGRLVRRNDVLFGADAMKPSGRRSRLSGAAIISEFRAWEPDAADIALLRNPHAAHSWPGRVLPVTREFGIVASTTTEFELGWKQP